MAMNWSFSDKSSSVPQYLCFQQQEGVPKSGFESLVSSGLLSIPATNTRRSKHRSHRAGVVEKIARHDRKHARVRYSATQPDKDTVNTKMRRNITALKSLTQSFDTATASRSSIVGSTDSSRNSTKIKDPELTIFYNGSVFVYDRVSPDKASAIMFLAGYDSPTACSISVPAVQVQKSQNVDDLVARQPYGTILDHVSRQSSNLSHSTPTVQVCKNGDGLVVSHATRISSEMSHPDGTTQGSTNGDSVAVRLPYRTSSSHVSTLPRNIMDNTRSRKSCDVKGTTGCLNCVSNLSSSVPQTVGKSSDKAKRARMNPSPLDSNDDDAERPIGILESSWNVLEPLRQSI